MASAILLSPELQSSTQVASSAAEKSSNSSFASAYQLAVGSSSSGSASTSGSEALAEFEAYAKASPGEQLFYNWLGAEGVSILKFKAMSPADQEALREKYAHQLEGRIEANAEATLSKAASATSAMAATSSREGTFLC